MNEASGHAIKKEQSARSSLYALTTSWMKASGCDKRREMWSVQCVQLRRVTSYTICGIAMAKH